MFIKTGFAINNYDIQYSVAAQVRRDVLKKFAENGVEVDYEKIVIHQAGPGVPGKTQAQQADPA